MESARTYHTLDPGTGVQTPALLLMFINGVLDQKLDFAIFAETQKEPEHVYEHLDWLRSLGGPPILTDSAGKLGEDLIHEENSTGGRFASIPAFTSATPGVTGGMPRRQCTSEYKIDVCERIIRRQVVGLQPRQRMPKGVRVVQHFGLSFDEPRRFTKVKARLVGHPWGEARFPLFDQEMSRSGCVAHLKRQDIPHEAPRSSCVFYPFKSNYEWMLLNDNAPVGWARAVEVDDALRRPGTIANRNLMFCAFEGRPLIVRLHGNGRVVEPGDGDWDALIARFPEYPGVRSVVVVDVERVADSCGFAVPLYEYQGERSQLIAYANSKGPEGMEQYKAQKYRASIDGTAGLRSVGGNGR